MSPFINKYKQELIICLSAVGAYLVTRLYNLKIIPIFTDEAIYSYWAQVALHDPANRVMSLEDGKQPLFIWLAAMFQYFVSDPLVATRLVSVSSGFLSMVGIYLLARELFGKTAAIVAATLYLLLPFTLLYDRMALYDSLLTMLGIFSVLLSVKLAKKLSLDFALLAGIFIGLATITKSSGNFFLYLLPMSAIFINPSEKTFKYEAIKWVFFSFISVLTSLLIYNSLRLFPLFYMISRKNHEFIRTLGEIAGNPLAYSQSNFMAIIGWLVNYTGILLMAAFIAGLVIGIASKDKRIIYLGSVIILPFIAEVIFNKILYPRFVLFYYPYILLVISYFFAKMLEKFPKKKNIIIAGLLIALLNPIYKSFSLITNPIKANVPSADTSQYLNSWPAGYGVEEVVEMLGKEAVGKDINVATEGTFGLFPFALNIYFYGNQNVHIYPFWPVDPDQLPAQTLELSRTNDTYFIFNENQEVIKNPRLSLVKSFQKGSGNSYMRLFKVLPQ